MPEERAMVNILADMDIGDSLIVPKKSGINVYKILTDNGFGCRRRSLNDGRVQCWITAFPKGGEINTQKWHEDHLDHRLRRLWEKKMARVAR